MSEDICKNCGEAKSEHLEARRKFTDEEVLACGKFIFTRPPKNKGYTFELRENEEKHGGKDD